MILIHSKDIPQAYMECIDRLFPNLTRIAVARSDEVYASIALHPDIFIFAPDHNTLVCSPSLYEKLSASLSQGGINVIRSRFAPHGRYPQTCLLNAARIGKYVFHNTRYTDPVIRDFICAAGLELINVGQGYTRCSVIPVAQNALIACDGGIAKKAGEIGIDVKLVSAGNVYLPGEEYGFIGGASGIAPDGRIIFLGDIRQHPDYIEIDRFINDHGIGYEYLPGLPLLDAGTLILLK